jgi:hypothetical protein
VIKTVKKNILPQSRKSRRKSQRRKEKDEGLKNLFDFFNFAVHKILHVSTVNEWGLTKLCERGNIEQGIDDCGAA